MSIKEIVDGWKNVVVSNEAIEELSKVRMSICNSCPYKTKLLQIDCCAVCHCPLVAKTRSQISICPKGRWEDISIIKEESMNEHNSDTKAI